MDDVGEFIAYFATLVLPILWGFHWVYKSSVQLIILIKNRKSLYEALNYWFSIENNNFFSGWIFSLGIVIIYGFYHFGIGCDLDFIKKNDGYYLSFGEHDLNTHNGSTLEYYYSGDGPFTEEEVIEMVENCESRFEKFVNNL